MNGLDVTNACPRCGYPEMRSWSELDDDDRFIIERLPSPTNEPLEQRKRHRFCKRCLFEDTRRDAENA